MKRLMLIVPVIALVASCGQKPEQAATEDIKTFQVVAEEAGEIAQDAGAAVLSDTTTLGGARLDASPAIGITAAPGVAFNYRYAFRLPNAKIASVQEEHARLCEKLGTNRCRITGMRYRLVDEDDVSAMLAFKLDPAIARQFGKDGIDLVGKAEGMLVDSEISGIDAGAAVTAADRGIAQLQDDLNRIEARLAL